MVFTEYMKVKNNLIVDTKYGKRRVINLVAKNGEEGAVWATDLDSLTHIKLNQTVEVIRGAKGSLSILEREQPRNIGGQGLKPVNEVLNNIPQSNGNGRTSTQQVANSAVDDYLDNDLGLPELLTDRQKQDLKKLTEERAKLLVFCIEVMKKEMDAKGFEFYENSVRSLGVSLFIQITRYLP
ncbi:hypothetical protein IQ255_24885 [Pleurocapsales cyanobacterium LEGE 10410]|nr:hypothetical protein [Pleurocapsales cyanobacterium LEGE 10410]